MVLEDGTCSAVVNGLAPITGDNCGVTLQTWSMTGATIGNSPGTGINDISGTTFNIGVTTVTYHIEDAAGNFIECSFDVEIYDVVDGGLIDADQTICYNTAPAAFTDEASASVCGGLTYQWQMKSGTAGAWNDIVGATSATYTELNNLTDTTYYNRKAISDLGFGTAYSDTITILIQPEPMANAGSDTTLCYGSIYQIQDADTSLSSGVTWEIFSGNGSFDNNTIIDPTYTPDASDEGTIVELVLHASGIGPCGENTDTVRLTYLNELLASIGKPTPYLIDSASTHIDVYVKISSHRYIGDLGIYLVSPLDSVVELKTYCVGFLSATEDITLRFYNDPLDTSALANATVSDCSPVSGRYEFVGDWKKKLHNQDPANGAWRIRLSDHRNITGSDGFLDEATITFGDLNGGGTFESILYADSTINLPITEGTPADPEITEYTLPITGLTVSCFGECDAQAVGSATGGLSPYLLYEWSTSIDFSTIYATGTNVTLCAGKYYLRVTDSHDCTAIDSVTVGEPPEIKITNATVLNNVCYGDSIGEVTLDFSGGTGALTYTHDSYTGAPKLSGETFDKLTAGAYIFTITDVSGCTKDTTINITEGTEITISTSINPITCHDAVDGEITISASGGTGPYGYSIAATPDFSNTTGIFTALDSGYLYVAVEDALGCIKYGDTIYMVNPDTISIDAIEMIPTSCFGGGNDGQIVVTTSGGVGPIGISTDGITFQYGNDTIMGLPIGDTTVYVRDNCETKMLDSLVTITGPVPIEIDSVVVNDVTTCFGDGTGEITVYARGGTGNFTYLIDGVPNTPPNDSVFTNVSSGTYIISVEDDDGCTGPDSTAIVDEPTQVVITGLTVTHTSECNTPQNVGIISFNGTGGSAPYSYTIVRESDMVSTTNPGVGLFEDLQADDYIIYVTDGNGCTSVQTDTAIILNSRMSIDADSIDITCFGDENGEAFVNITDSTGSVIYNWTGPNGFTSTSDTAKNLEPGTYYVTVTDSNSPDNCVDTDSVILENPEDFNVLLDSKPVYCINSIPIDVDAAKGYINPGISGGTGELSYAWTGPNSFSANTEFINGLEVGTYFLTITDEAGCDTIVDETISESLDYDITDLSVSFKDLSVCWNEPVEITLDYNGDADTANYRIGIYDPDLGGYFYDDDAEKTQQIIISPFVTYHYISEQAVFDRFEVENDYCRDYETGFIEVEYFPSFNLDISDIEGNIGDTIYLKGSRDGQLFANVIDASNITFQWFEADVPISQSNVQILSISPDSSATYTVAATSTDECTDTTSVYLEFIPAITPNEGFTPNGDGINDYWDIKFIDKFPNNVVTIYNRWGVKVFEQKGYHNDDENMRWDGTAKNGKELASGTYYYVIILNEEGFNPITGPITIIR